MLVDKRLKSNKASSRNYIIFDLSKVPYTREELLNGFSVFKEFMTKWQCDVKTMCKAIDELSILDSHLFDFSTWHNNDFLVEEDVYYSVSCNKRTNYNQIKTYYNVYVTPYPYASLALNNIAEYIIRARFPELFKDNFLKVEKRFDENVHKLPSSTSAKLSDINNLMTYENDLTIQDLIDIYTAKDREKVMDEMIATPRIKIYANGFIALTVDEKHDYSLCFTIEDLYNKDWEKIEKKHVFSIPLYDKHDNLIKGKWYEGEQKNAPYFNCPLVKELERIFKL